MADGTVQWFNVTKGFGFIVPDDGTYDVFVDVSTIEGFSDRKLVDGQRVVFDAEPGPEGLRATSVRPPGTDARRR